MDIDLTALADITSDLAAASIMIAETMARVDLARP